MHRYSKAALAAALALTAACAKRTDDGAVEDSAAARVATTPLAGDSAGATARTTGVQPAASDSTRARVAPSDSSRSTSGAAPTTTGRAAAAARSTAPASAPATSASRATTATAPAAAVTRSTSPVVTASAAGPTAPKSPAPAQDATVEVNKFMSYDAASKTVTLQVTAALTSQRGGFNFNGGSDGSQTITVPQGWTVRMHVRNVDAIPHSAILILDQKPVPNAPETPAISRAYTSHVSDGLPAQTGEDDVEFRASKAGNYLIICGVPGHGPSGMYIRFVVSADATAPSYSM